MSNPPHDPETLHRPWLVAVWPGMGNVALAAGGTLLDLLDTFELPLPDLRQHFEVDTARVKGGLVRKGGFPRNRLYGWKDPQGKRDLLIFVGEAQPNVRGYAFCHTLLDLAAEYGVARVVTFASMVTPSYPDAVPRLFAIATEEEVLQGVVETGLEVTPLEDCDLTGLNGTLLAAAAERGEDGMGLLGEVPAMAASVPYLRAAQRVLELFGRVSGIELDLSRLKAQADRLEEGFREMLQRVRLLANSEQPSEGEAEGEAEPEPKPGPKALPGPLPAGVTSLTPEAFALIESLFLVAEGDRSRAWELKAELDRLGLFKDYEDRFLDLFG